MDYRWKGGKSQGVEIVSKEMAQFDFVGAKTTTKANTNSKGTTLYINKNRWLYEAYQIVFMSGDFPS